MWNFPLFFYGFPQSVVFWKIILCSGPTVFYLCWFCPCMIFTLVALHVEIEPDDIFDIQDFNLHDIFNLGINNQVGGAAVSVESCGDGPSNP